MSIDFITIHDMIVRSWRNLSQDDWDYICGAAESETSLRRNRLALDCLAFRPRILRDVRQIDTSTDFLNQKLSIPVILAPMGSLERFTPNGGNDVDSAAETTGTMGFFSTVTEPSLEEIAAHSLHPKVFQIYVRGDDDWIRALVRRVVKADYWGVALTVDSAFYGNRERLNPTQVALRHKPDREFQKGLTWDTVKLIQDEIGDRPFMLKGIMTAEDALLAVEHGVQVIYVSNHGGRELDHVQGCIEVLPEIVAAVDGKATVIIDGGFTRGTDIIKAIALGAKAVGIGRLQAWALGAGGAEGLVKCLELLEDEIRTTMGLLGITSLAQLDGSYLTKALPVRLPHEMSAFPHLPGDRIV
jgi:isopentenyl diphosphate isomerase/L-lactate dehydrogenase-like FMN-dependent dehydrogenase